MTRRAVVVFDGGCGLCRGSAGWLRRLDWCRRLRPVPAQDPDLYLRHPGLAPEACLAAMHVVLPGGRIRVGGDAVRAVLARLPLTAPLALVLAIPPLPAALRAFYPWIAARRRRLSRACRL